MAYHAHTTDLRDDLEGDQTVSTHWVDVLENSYLEPINRNQYYLAAKYGGFRVPEGFDPASPESDMIQDQDWHTSGEMLYPGNQNNLSGQPIKRPDNYYLAGRADRMVASLEAAFATIVANIQASSASIAANSTRLDTDTLVFQARFNSASWRGDLFAYRLQSDGSLGSVPQWDAASVLDGMNLADRNVLFAGSSGTLEPFSWENLSAAQRTILNNNDLGESRIAYLTGNRTQERQNGGPFRTRSSRLGDIVNSNPAFSGQESYGYHRLPGAEGSSYYSFYQQKRNEELRPPVVYVGANDGMLHAFHADTGEELFAYVPSMVLPQMAALSEPGYEHRYSVDGSPTIADAYIDGEWRTVLIGALGAGGRGLFALDITHPNEPELLWEFTHPELGEGVEEVSVVRTEVGNQDDPKWIVALGNGYNSASGQAALLLIDLASGEMLAESPVYTGAGSVDEPNGMAAVIAISSSGGRTADTMYAGDLQGNLWKFDQIQANGNNKGVWRLADGEDEPLFTAVSPDQGAPRQPITSKPEAGFNSDGQVMIYFGTGKYLEAVDVESSGLRFTHSAYGIVDDGSLGITRDDLIEQEIIYEDTAHDRQVRVVSNNPRTENSMGWYLDLVPPGNNGESNGERIVVRPVLRGESVVFVTLIPSSSPCDTGGTSWMMALSRDTGGRIDGGVFDVDGDGVVDENDYVVIDGVEVPVSGLGSESGILTRPNILAGIDGVDSGYVTGSTGDTERFNIQGDGTGLGRQSWRQLR
ncbi:Tfp pilus assembly protein, tip-associated adhesin PilY1 [Isoalcanivorax pacificus W11-5]|uniref:Tfp pilus assembly protein, tip-associated adhesin PilY1 n=1 Tax=Isoalcanivorax pacificus W11-5 TaxID=391936 RepID=A0A0B4XL29_9GAMM|nr:Tfp pilus assembly protein, tip-associated adhesin PilY1 [Isoalcanivorax pacificus W11-5]